MNRAILDERLPFSESIPLALADDTAAILEKLATGKPLDVETHRRIRERAEPITREVYRQHGVVEIGVNAIRSLRDQEAA